MATVEEVREIQKKHGVEFFITNNWLKQTTENIEKFIVNLKDHFEEIFNDDTDEEEDI